MPRREIHHPVGLAGHTPSPARYRRQLAPPDPGGPTTPIDGGATGASAAAIAASGSKRSRTRSDVRVDGWRDSIDAERLVEEGKGCLRPRR